MRKTRLVISRKPGQLFVIRLGNDMPAGTEVAVDLTTCNMHKATFGVSADSSIEIDREEIRQKKDAENIPDDENFGNC